MNSYYDKAPIEASDDFDRMHDYHDANGAYLYTKVIWKTAGGGKKARWGVKATESFGSEGFEPKTYEHWPSIWQCRGHADIDLVPYNLKETLAAIVRGEQVLILEGEKDCNTAIELGFNATCNPEGATYWAKRHSETLQGIKAVIIPDNDEHGQQHAEKVVRSLRGEAREMRLLQIEGLEDKGDLSDWVEKQRSSGGSPEAISEDLKRRMRGAPRQTFERTPVVNGRGGRRGGGPVKSYRNFKSGIKLLGYEFIYEEMSRGPKYRIVDDNGNVGPWRGKDNASDRHIRNIMEESGLTLTSTAVDEHVHSMAEQKRVNLLLEEIKSYRWDGTPRIETWLHNYAYAEDNEYIRAVSRLTLMAGIGRLIFPGMKFDQLPVLESGEGSGKSTLIQMLATDRQWFSDNLPMGAEAKVVLEQTKGKWIVEFAELDGMHKKDNETLLHFMSCSVDGARAAYGKNAEEHARKFITIGTTNSTSYLRSNGRNRRFWPVKVTDGQMDLNGFKRVVKQLWAEAYALMKESKSMEQAEAMTKLPSHLWPVAQEETNSRIDKGNWQIELEEMLDDLEEQPDIKIKAVDLYRYVDGLNSKVNASFSKVNPIMAKKGYVYKAKIRFDKKQHAGYFKGDEKKANFFQFLASM